ncbi:hypothetical protein [uncultured Alistipes sp.]|uniref:hypothetical protein n=1 Tax=uncultured Alistipes sp. TaxID=538949 RepID=UPI0027D960B6|nr:hypothetical protein [uncultured Alistipes sp.]
MEIRSLANTNFETLYKAFSRAFADYEVQINKRQFQAMLVRRGFDAGLSFAAFDAGDIVAFTLNGTGDLSGCPRHTTLGREHFPNTGDGAWLPACSSTRYLF